MSILLEALRKSERRAHLGEIPTIHQDGDGPEPRRASRLLVLAALALAAVVLGILFWHQYAPAPAPAAPSSDPAAVAATPAADTGASPAEPTNPLPESAMAESAQADAARREARTPMERALPEAAFDATQPVARATPSAPIESSSPEAARQHEPTRPETDSRPPVTTLRIPPRLPDLQADRAAADSTAGQPHQSEPISYWQLPPDIRSQLPPLKISVLVWAERPQDRFVLLDSRRRVEGDDVAPGLRLEEVRRDGVIMSFRAYRFLVRS